MLRACLIASAIAVITIAGCAPLRPSVQTASGPFFVSANNQEVLWERTVDVLHDYPFQIARENKLDGVIETDYKIGSGVLEPWHKESVGSENRWESTLQSIRRRVIVSLTPADGGYLVGVEAFKELEDLPGLAANSPGGATFQNNDPLTRDLNQVVGQTAPSGWIPSGRDFPLEQDIVARLRNAYSR